MSEDEFYNTLKGFTIEDVPYLLENKYLSEYGESSSYIYYTTHKPFRLDDVQMDYNDNIRYDKNTNKWLYNKPRND